MCFFCGIVFLSRSLHDYCQNKRINRISNESNVVITPTALTVLEDLISCDVDMFCSKDIVTPGIKLIFFVFLVFYFYITFARGSH